MKSKTITILIIWLFISTATAATVAYIRHQKEAKFSQEVRLEIETSAIEDEKKQIKASNKAESSLRSKEEILSDLDRGMERLLEE